MLNNDWKTYRNHRKFDIECVEFTTSAHKILTEQMYITSGFRAI